MFLTVEGVEKRFAGVRALRGVSFDTDQGRVVGLVGPNGSGKTTLLNVCSGVYRPEKGSVALDGARISGLRGDRVARAGVARTFQAPRVFKTLTVFQNLRVPLIHSGLSDGEVEARARDLLGLVGLEQAIAQRASELSGGQQKLLEFARALMAAPRLVLMDEPFAGVHPTIKSTMVAAVERKRDEGLTFVIVSHELPLMVRLVDQLVCMAEGSVLVSGVPDTVRKDERVVEAYLGQQHGSTDP